jgi:glucokinase
VSLAIGIDIGGTKTAIGVVDTENGLMFDKQILNTPSGSGLDCTFLDQIANVVRGMKRLPIGIGICELVDTSGKIASQSKFKWTSRDVQLAFDFAPSVKLESDVRAAAVAEGRFGAGVGLDHWMYVNAGTGIAAVLMHGSKPYVGANGLGMSFGMSPSSLVADGPQPTIEDLAGARGMLHIARSQNLKTETLQDLIAVSPKILEQGGSVLGRAIGMLANMFDPRTIVLGGGVALTSAAYRLAFEEALHKTVWSADVFRSGIAVANLGVDSGLIGAAFVAASAIQSLPER